MTSTGDDRPLYKCSTQGLGLQSTGSVPKTPTRPCFAHRPDYSSVFTYGLGLNQYNCSGNIRVISGYRTLAYRASHNIIVLSCLRTQLFPTCNTLQINVNSCGFLHIHTQKVILPHSKHYHQHPIYFPWYNYTLGSLRFMPILDIHTESDMIYTSEQHRIIQVFT